MREQVACNRASLILKTKHQNTQTSQLFSMNTETEIIYKKYLKCQAGRLGWRDLGV